MAIILQIKKLRQLIYCELFGRWTRSCANPRIDARRRLGPSKIIKRTRAYSGACPSKMPGSPKTIPCDRDFTRETDCCHGHPLGTNLGFVETVPAGRAWTFTRESPHAASARGSSGPTKFVSNDFLVFPPLAPHVSGDEVGIVYISVPRSAGTDTATGVPMPRRITRTDSWAGRKSDDRHSGRGRGNAFAHRVANRPAIDYFLLMQRRRISKRCPVADVITFRRGNDGSRCVGRSGQLPPVAFTRESECGRDLFRSRRLANLESSWTSKPCRTGGRETILPLVKTFSREIPGRANGSEHDLSSIRHAKAMGCGVASTSSHPPPPRR